MRFGKLLLWHLAVDKDGVIFEETTSRLRLRNTAAPSVTNTPIPTPPPSVDFTVTVKHVDEVRLMAILSVHTPLLMNNVYTMTWGRDTCWAFNEFKGCQNNQKLTWARVITNDQLVSKSLVNVYILELKVSLTQLLLSEYVRLKLLLIGVTRDGYHNRFDL